MWVLEKWIFILFIFSSHLKTQVSSIGIVVWCVSNTEDYLKPKETYQ